MFVLFLSPPEIPRVICVPTCRKHEDPQHQPKQTSRLEEHTAYVYFFTLESATLVRPSSLMR